MDFSNNAAPIVNLTSRYIVEKWKKLRTFGGFSSDHIFADFLLSCEEKRQNVHLSEATFYNATDGPSVAKEKIKCEIGETDEAFDLASPMKPAPTPGGAKEYFDNADNLHSTLQDLINTGGDPQGFYESAAAAATIATAAGVVEHPPPIPVAPNMQEEETLSSKFFCPICKITLKSKEYHNHMVVKHSTHECTFCAQQYQTREELQLHYEDVHGQRFPTEKQRDDDDPAGFDCEVCGKKLISNVGYKLHMELLHSNAEPLACEVCGKCFKIRKYLNNHYKQVHLKFYLQQKKKLGKQREEEKSERRRLKNERLKLKRKEKLAAKKLKPSTWKSKQPELNEMKREYEEAIRIEQETYQQSAGDLPYHEQMELVKFVAKLELDEKLDKDPYCFQCHFCVRWFKRANDLNYHLERACESGTLLVPEDFICTVCGRHLSDKKSYKQHFLTAHTDDMPFECSLCNKKFKVEFYLKTHLKKHSGERDLMCRFCGKGFYSSNILKSHERVVHSNESYACKECGKSFNSSAGLNNHTRLHTGNLFLCDFCGRGFVTRTMLKNHRLTAHIKTKNYKCHLCSAAFPVTPALNSHMKRMHGDGKHTEAKKYPCEYCEKTFPSNWKLKEHVNSHVSQAAAVASVTVPIVQNPAPKPVYGFNNFLYNFH